MKHVNASAAAIGAVLLALVISGRGLGADTPAAAPAGPGVMQIPGFEIPPSRYLSKQGEAMNIAMQHVLAQPKSATQTADELRAAHDAALTPVLNRMRQLYNVQIADDQIAGVPVRVITPGAGGDQKNKDRVLINLHGGAFFQGEKIEALVESVPVAAVAGMKVITVSYRQGPEYKFPAATEDAEAVYREVLKTTKPQNVGIYGCSAEGALTAMVAAALIRDKVPLPGGIGIFSSGAYADFSGDPREKGTWGGDSRYWAPPLYGQPKLPLTWSEQPIIPAAKAYLAGVDLSDPLASPAESSELLARFPPTLILTGTRSYDMSAAVETHRQLVKNGVDADLHVWDGVGHCFIFVPDIPESREAYDVIGKFFNSRLGR